MNDWQREDETSHWTVYDQKESHCNKLDTATPEILAPRPPWQLRKDVPEQICKEVVGEAQWQTQMWAPTCALEKRRLGWGASSGTCTRKLKTDRTLYVQTACQPNCRDLCSFQFALSKLDYDKTFAGGVWHFVRRISLNPVDDPGDSFSKMAEWPFHEFTLDWLPADCA